MSTLATPIPFERLQSPSGSVQSRLTQAAIDRVAAAASDRRIALMLYGSRARGTGSQNSDIDVLELVKHSPEPQTEGLTNVSQYLPRHLHEMARGGSLFVLHLRMEGKILSDPTGVLSACLDAYRSPQNYDAVWEQIRVASGALDVRASDATDHLDGLARLGIYLLRTAVYLRCVKSGTPTFDIAEALRHLNAPGLDFALALRRKQGFELMDLEMVRSQLDRFVPGCWRNDHESVEAFAVANAHRADVAALLTGVLSASSKLEYSAMTLPPF